jgi:hypothetical protein
LLLKDFLETYCLEPWVICYRFCLGR